MRSSFLIALLAIGLALTRAAPSPAGVGPEEILAQLDAYAPEVLAGTGVPGMSLAVVVDDKVVFARSYGVKAVNGTDPVDERTVFQIGSCTKAFTSALTAWAVDQGLVAWSDPAVKRDNRFAMRDPWVTANYRLSELMAQHSGLPAYAADGLGMFGFDRDWIIQSLRHLEPETGFRTEFAYQNSLFLVMARIIEARTDRSWAEAIGDVLLTPLGMTGASVGTAAIAAATNRADLHYHGEQGPFRIPWKATANKFIDAYAPAGAINASAVDMAEWVRFQLAGGIIDGRRLISQANLDRTKAPQTVMAHGFYGRQDVYAMGWVRSRYCPETLIQHGGNTMGAHSFVCLAPEAGVGVVALTNTHVNKAPEIMAWRLMDLFFNNPIRDFLGGDSPTTAWTVGPVRAITLSSAPPPTEAVAPSGDYSGQYWNPVYDRITVSSNPPDLKAAIGPLGYTVDLINRGNGRYQLRWDELLYFLGTTDGGLVEFNRPNHGGPLQLTIDLLNGDGEGVFEKVN